MTAALEGVNGQQHDPAALYHRERPGTRFTEGWVGPRVGLDGRKNLVPTGIRSRTFHPVVSRYTDWATLPTHIYKQIHTHMVTFLTAWNMDNIEFEISH